MDFHIVKVTEKNVGLHQPIVAVGDKSVLLGLLEERYGTDAEIVFSPKKFEFSEMFIPKLSEGLYSFNDLIWNSE